MLVKKTLEEYFCEAASSAEIPGGGSVSGVIGALGSCMASMAANFTLGKKKYAEIEKEVSQILAVLESQREILKANIDKDAEAFLKFNDVYAMPNSSDEEKAARTASMQACLLGAMQPPLDIMIGANECLKVLPQLAEIGNKNLITDTGVAALGLRAAIEAARLNVLINLKWLKDEKQKEMTKEKVEAILSESKQNSTATLKLVEEAL